MDTEVLKKIKNNIRESLRYNTHNGCIRYKDCDNICYDIECELCKIPGIATDDPESAFKALMFINRKCVYLASYADSSSGYLTEVINEVFYKLDVMCDAISVFNPSPLCTKCYNALCKEALRDDYDGWGDWNYSLLAYATYFISSKNKERILSCLAILKEKNKDDEFNYNCCLKYEETVLSLIEKRLIS